MQRNESDSALRAMGPQVEVWMRDIRQNAPGEIRARCDGVLTGIGVKAIDNEDIRRVMLATRMLEIIGTPKAMALRRRWWRIELHLQRPSNRQ